MKLLKVFLLSLLPFCMGKEEGRGSQQRQSQPAPNPMVRAFTWEPQGLALRFFSLPKLFEEFETHFSASQEQPIPADLSAPLEHVTHNVSCWNSAVLFRKIFLGWGADSQHLYI